jgi:hypothetical protein
MPFSIIHFEDETVRSLIDSIEQDKVAQFFRYKHQISLLIHDNLIFGKPSKWTEYHAHVLSCCAVLDARSQGYSINRPGSLSIEFRLEGDTYNEENAYKGVQGRMKFYYPAPDGIKVILEGEAASNFGDALQNFIMVLESTADDLEQHLQKDTGSH